MDKDTGIFVSGYPGSYAATWSLVADMDSGNHMLSLYLRKNGQIIEESHHLSQLVSSGHYMRDQGGRTMILHLNRGDTLDLYCEDCTAGILYVTFCVSLSQFDVE
eukprot:TRINITY_DN16715_c0_g1_i1.p1 TRINITY_DN16715_c0_g1~~TRINITY_DN16715_c0_g1_i1.p1  ORF type:complete len:105 (-),score=4.34 TRINITY_DN16715_c0_g1_i1:22-336(-)